MIGLRNTWISLLALAALPAASLSLAAETGAEQQVERIRQIVLLRQDDPAAVAHLVQLTSKLSEADGAILFNQIADDFLAATQHDRAGELLRQLVDQYPNEPATADGLLQLVRLYASSEVATSQIRTTGHAPSTTDLATFALHSARKARAKNRTLAADPRLTFQCAVAARRSGRPAQSQGFLTPLKHNPRAEPWHGRARAEAWLLSGRQDDAPLRTRQCAKADVRPVLDGILDEPFWKSAMGDRAGPPTRYGFARDKEFFYLAVRCKKFPGTEYAVDNRKRNYDANLSAHDHIELQLDLDRDYATCFFLAVDHRGWTADRCWMAKDWNPRWFVAARQDQTHWTVEAAIPWTELGGTAPPAKEAWAIACQRVAPYSQPTQTSFDLLLFEDLTEH